MFSTRPRMTGLSGLDTESMVRQIMQAESIRHTNMLRRATLTSFRQEAFRAVGVSIRAFEQNVLSLTGAMSVRLQRSFGATATTTTTGFPPVAVSPNTLRVQATSTAAPGNHSLHVYRTARGARFEGARLPDFSPLMRGEAGVIDVGRLVQIREDGTFTGVNGFTFNVSLDGGEARAITLSEDDMMGVFREAFGFSTGLTPHQEAELARDDLTSAQRDAMTQDFLAQNLAEANNNVRARLAASIGTDAQGNHRVDFGAQLGGVLNNFVGAVNTKLYTAFGENVRASMSGIHMRIHANPGHSARITGNENDLGVIGFRNNQNTTSGVYDMLLSDIDGALGFGGPLFINGVRIGNFLENPGPNEPRTVRDLMNVINNSGAGVNLRFEHGSGRFILENTGAGGIDFGDPNFPGELSNTRVLQALGLFRMENRGNGGATFNDYDLMYADHDLGAFFTLNGHTINFSTIRNDEPPYLQDLNATIPNPNQRAGNEDVIIPFAESHPLFQIFGPFAKIQNPTYHTGSTIRLTSPQLTERGIPHLDISNPFPGGIDESFEPSMLLNMNFTEAQLAAFTPEQLTALEEAGMITDGPNRGRLEILIDNPFDTVAMPEVPNPDYRQYTIPNPDRYIPFEEVTIGDMLRHINNQSAFTGVEVSHDGDRFVFHTTGDRPGREINFGTTIQHNERFLEFFGITGEASAIVEHADGRFHNRQDAIVRINGGPAVYRASNTFEIAEGVTVTLGNVRLDGDRSNLTANAVNGTASTPPPVEFDIEIRRDTEEIRNTILNFVEEYNKLMRMLLDQHRTPRPRSTTTNQFYEPLTDEERRTLSESEVRMWDERAREGLLHRNSTIETLMRNMRQAVSNPVLLANGTRMSLSQIGITTTNRIADGGILEIDMDRLDRMLEERPEDIMQMFTQSAPAADMELSSAERAALRRNSQGLGDRLNDLVNNAIGSQGSLTRIAGSEEWVTSLNNNNLYRELRSQNNRIDTILAQLQRREEQLWRMFSQLETAMIQAESQMSSMMAMLGQNMWGGG